MSNLLNEAIIDAKALKEAALMNAEAAVIRKYSAEVKQTLDTLLEQEEDAPAADPMADLGAEEPPAGDPLADLGAEEPMGAPEDLDVAAPGEEIADVAPDVPLSATDGIGSSAKEGTPIEFNVDLQALQEAVAALESELSEDEEIEINEVDLAALLGEDDSETPDPEADVDYTAGVGQSGDPAGGEAADETADSIAMKNAGLEEGASDEDEEDPAPFQKGKWANKTDAEHTAGAEKHRKANPGGIPKGTDYDPEKEKSEPYKGSSNRMRDRLSETEQTTEALVDAIMEKLTVDMGADLSGWAGRSSNDIKFEIEKEMAHRRSTDVSEEMKDLKKAQEELVFENNHLNEKLTTYEQAVGQLKGSLQEVNLSNARLLYTNRILRNTSLNERQKTKIVEAISNAGSVAEARTIFDTLQSTVESTPKRGPQSLGEAISRRSSVIRASRHESTPSDPISDRMKKLAGIK